MIPSYSIEPFFDKTTSTMTYVVYDSASKDALIIDPVLDFDQARSVCTMDSIKNVVAFVENLHLKIHFILETHAHADHLSGARQLVTHYFPDAKIAIGERITVVQTTFKKIFNLPETFDTGGRVFSRLFKDNEKITAGTIHFKVLYTPGHTPACVSYMIGDAVFTGDALFMPDSGTGRCDFPDGDAKSLYHSISDRLYRLPDATHVFVGHDYQPGQRALAYRTTIAESKSLNIQLKANTPEAEYIAFRTQRDATLSAPKLLFPSIQVNIAAGALPIAESNGHSYLKLPITLSLT